MKKKILLFVILVSLAAKAQNNSAFKSGEWFKFRIHYGLVTAGYATLELKEAAIKNKKAYSKLYLA